MSTRKAVVDSYMEGFRQSDHARILACLTDDVVWDILGYRHLEGKEAFDGEIEGGEPNGSPILDVDRVVEEGETVVVLGEGRAALASGATRRFAFCTVFTFAGDLIRHVESYVVPLSGIA
jgi:ketosteroid isomerase-like protein